MRFNKKASLNLSINAIVVLVMAMVVLGLGLTFIKTLLGTAQDKFVEVVKEEDIKNPATEQDPFKIPEELSISASKENKLTFSFYNLHDSGNYTPEIDNSAGSDCAKMGFKKGYLYVEKGTAKSFRAIMQDNGTVRGTKVCTVGIKAYDHASTGPKGPFVESESVFVDVK